MPVRGLTIVIAEASTARFRSALTLALAQIALGGAACIFLDGAAVALARIALPATDDDMHIAAGLPSLAELRDEALDAGMRLVLCQSGLALTDSAAEDHDPRAEFGGMVGVLAAIGDDRLIMA